MRAIESISIFSYQDPALYLRDVWNRKRAFNRNFSLRAWAKQLGISSHGTFYHIVQGKRPLPKKYLKPLSTSLQLDAKEALYLETLVDLGKAKTTEHKSFYSERLQELAPGEKLNFYEIESFHFLKNPINGAIIELTTLKDFCSDPRWIQERIAIKASLNEVKKSLNLLLDLNLLKIDNGELKRSNALLHTKQDVKNEALQEYHKNVLQMGADQVSKQDPISREFNASAFGVKKDDLPKAKTRIREFLNDFIKEFEAEPGHADEIYQLGIQYFALTNNKEKQ